MSAILVVVKAVHIYMCDCAKFCRALVEKESIENKLRRENIFGYTEHSRYLPIVFKLFNVLVLVAW